MSQISSELSALVGSRICHDLISPLGAIGNGVELLELNKAATGAEMALIAQSVEHAQARVRFFRIAFGAAGKGQSIAQAEVRSVLENMANGSRSKIEWQVHGDLLRSDVRLAFLLLLCCETAMPFGGVTTVTSMGRVWTLTARSEKLAYTEPLWSLLKGPVANPDISAAHVQFALASDAFDERGKFPDLDVSETEIRMSFTG